MTIDYGDVGTAMGPIISGLTSSLPALIKAGVFILVIYLARLGLGLLWAYLFGEPPRMEQEAGLGDIEHGRHLKKF